MGVEEPVEEEITGPELAKEPVMDTPFGMLEEPVMEEIPSAEEEIPVFETVEPVPEQAVTETVEEPVPDQAEETALEEEAIMVPQEVEETAEDKTTIQYNGGEEKKMDVQTNRVAVDETAVVTEGMTITGDIISEGSMELIGTVNGNLDILGKLNITGSIQGNSKAAEIYAEGAKITGEVNSLGSVKIGQSSVVIGNILATSAVIAGAVKGDIDVKGPVILDTTAIVMGNIKSKSVQINNGAVIEGMCSQCYADVNPSSFFEEFKKKK
ncbi:MAG: polymer-forming cytoskeletal protein [Lachnospiraceae bacterium]|nr:polymer-forming cytoskeletal protein [Lachnospiraceae bacterium]